MSTSQRSGDSNGDPLWYKDAIIYELHVRAFYDSNADGMGDFRGLSEKLDYLQDLGVTTIWVLPFFPSPWKDDGYDISDFRGVHPAYGTLRDFQIFVREAHRRNLKVITELVVNHTSDQHEWFQKSRHAEPGSSWRNFYVWSNSPDKYAGTRIIFKDFEPSNWSWDPLAKAYYWHRFYSHQPDLNFDSPLVRRTVMRTLDYWAGMGVDGFRLDAIPYLYEREGTSCENLAETHSFLKELRQHLDAGFPNRMLLSEANMWPEDAVAYYGAGDECHMNFHFPLMPRLFMALRLEDRLPIVEILKRTPAIPETCQWAMFLRNHDELTLEMVTDEERDYMYRAYAADQRARINLGIRRRLAPLLGNDRPRIEVMNALLFSMPGTPVIYYGDEIGMGDNVYLGDRNGVRTPMQWSPDRNAGFSATNPQKLYLPVNIDPAYHYEAINVESQGENPASLLSWTKRIIALRKQYKAFGRGTLEFLSPKNQRVLAFLRRYQQELILVVANLSRFAQAVELDMSKYQGYVPVEMFGRNDFPMICDRPYSLTLGPNSFFWFSLEQRGAPAGVSAPAVEWREPRIPIIAVHDIDSIWTPEIRASIASVMPRFLITRRWLRSKARRFRSIAVIDSITVIPEVSVILLVRAEYTTSDPEEYLVPLVLARDAEAARILKEQPHWVLTEVHASDGSRAILYSGTRNSEFCTGLLEAFARRRRLHGENGEVTPHRNRLFRTVWGEKHPNFEPALMPSAEINTSIRFGDRFVLKLLRMVEPGVHPGVEIGELLTAPPAFEHAAPFTGYLEYARNTGEKYTLGVLHGFVQNAGTAWHTTRRELVSFFDRKASSSVSEEQLQQSAPINIYNLDFDLSEPPQIARNLIGSYLDFAGTMGRRTAEMHAALLRNPDNPAFAPEPFNDFYRQSLFHGDMALTTRRLEFIRQRYGDMSAEIRPLAAKVLEQEAAIQQKFRTIFDQRIPSQRTRFHGRLHLGHLLVTGSAGTGADLVTSDVAIYDFEGDPAQHVSERRIKRCPLRDVASMLASLGYAALSAVRVIVAAETSDAVPPLSMRIWGRFWYSHVSAAYIRGYWSVAKDASYMPQSREHQQILLQTYLLERALLDIREDIQDKPELSGIPFRLILHLLDAEAERKLGE